MKLFTEYGGFRVWSAAVRLLRGAVSTVAACSVSRDILARSEHAQGVTRRQYAELTTNWTDEPTDTTRAMSQIFRPSANQLARTSLVGTLLLVALLGASAYGLMRSDFVTGANTNIEQPIQFSHAHHVGGLGIDCRYCHTSVEQSSFANIPPTKTCMNCHSQIWSTSPYLEPVRASYRTGQSLQWVRVHNLPDFVYFNHSIHVKKGIGCETCHGRIDQMPGIYQARTLQMEWCLDCHRAPEKFVRPREAVTVMGYEPPVSQAEIGARLVEQYQIQKLDNCSVCHR